MEKIKAWIRLAGTPDVGITTALRLVEELGPPENYIGKQDVTLSHSAFLSETAKNYLSKNEDPPDWARIAKWLEKLDLQFITYLDDEYPPLLKSITDPPLYLYIRGQLQKQDFMRCFAIVGTRKATFYGKAVTPDISSALAKSGFTIVSGLAHGIDTLAHQAAISAKGRTIAVMGTGCEQIYPPANRELADRICEHGFLISEYDPGSKPERWNFPNRNRIISGLSLGCLVVEGNLQSGALLTARFANEQKRDVFALPGDIGREESAGPNDLLKKGAHCVTKADDILSFYQVSADEEEQPSLFPELSEKEEKLYQYMLLNRPEVYFDQLIVNTGFSVGELSTLLLSLELKKVIQRLPGSKFALRY